MKKHIRHFITIAECLFITNLTMLWYEFSMQVVFVVHQFYMALTPAFIMPQNLVLIAGRPDLPENGKNLLCNNNGWRAFAVSINEKLSEKYPTRPLLMATSSPSLLLLQLQMVDYD